MKRAFLLYFYNPTPPVCLERSLSGVEAAARVGWSVLLDGGTAVDAVEAAVIALEDNPVFDAGTG